jgi:putative ABC transport system permease protein
VISLRNLFRNKIRTLLTLIGIAIGVSVFVSSITIIYSFQKQTRSIIRNYDIDITVQSKGAPTPVLSKIPITDYERMKEISGIREISSLVIGSIRTPWTPYFVVVGLSSFEMLARKFHMKDGRFLIPHRKEIVLGEGAAASLKLKVNDSIALTDDHIFTVVGIFSTGHLLLDSGVVLGIEDAQRVLKKDDHFNLVFIRVAIDASPQDVLERIQGRFPELSAKPASDFVNQIRLFKTIESVSWVISMISFVTCCVVVMNTFIMVVTERKKEIGILMAVGWSKMRIINNLLSEAVILCLLGSLLGVGLALIYFRILNHMDTIGFGWAPQSIPADMLLLSTATSVAAGLLGSIYPAIAASRLSPSAALRSE